MENKRIYHAYLIRINSKGTNIILIVSNLVKAHRYIKQNLKETYIEYDEKDFYKYDTLAKKIQKNQYKEIVKQIRDTNIKLQKFEIL